MIVFTPACRSTSSASSRGPGRLGSWAFPVTVFWIVLVTNALNLIDGLDGLAGGVAVLAGTTLFVMSVVEGNVVGALLLCSMVGATLGFLRFNWNPASIFLGDTGSLFLGFLLALSSTHGSRRATRCSASWRPSWRCAAIFDLSMAVIRRYMVGKPVFAAISTTCTTCSSEGASQRQTALILLGGATTLGLLALVFIYTGPHLGAQHHGARDHGHRGHAFPRICTSFELDDAQLFGDPRLPPESVLRRR